MIRLILILMLALPLPSMAWNKSDTQRETIWQLIHVVDWGQTVDIAKNPNRYSEINPLIGEHPSVNDVHRYMIASSLTHYLVSRTLKPRYRKYWQYITIGMTGTLIAHNYSVGLRINF